MLCGGAHELPASEFCFSGSCTGRPIHLNKCQAWSPTWLFLTEHGCGFTTFLASVLVVCLQCNEDWKALVRDAHKRKGVVSVSSSSLESMTATIEAALCKKGR